MTAERQPGAGCDRFEREGLARLERGEPLGAHYDSCADCLRARAAHQRLRAALTAAGDGDEPPGDWQAKVWAEIARRGERRGARRWVALLPLGAALAAVVLLLVLWPPAVGPSLTARVEPGPHRGGGVRPGDRLHLEARTGGAAVAELRLYLDGRELLLRCAAEPPCVRDGDRLTAVVVLPDPGSYRPLLLTADAPPPPGGDGWAADLAAAEAAGARALAGEVVVVE